MGAYGGHPKDQAQEETEKTVAPDSRKMLCAREGGGSRSSERQSRCRMVIVSACWASPLSLGEPLSAEPGDNKDPERISSRRVLAKRRGGRGWL